MNEDIQKVETGQWVMAITTVGGMVAGVLVKQGEVALQESGIQKFYKICLIGSYYINLYENELISLKPVVEDRNHYLKDFAKEHDIKCSDEEGMLSNSQIMAKIIYDDKWGELSDDKKEEFIHHIRFSDEDIAEIINVLFGLKQENKKMYQTRLNALDMSSKSLTAYQEIIEKNPECAPIYKFVYEQLGIEKLINCI